MNTQDKRLLNRVKRLLVGVHGEPPCRHCKADVGQLHILGCPNEDCPFCEELAQKSRQVFFRQPLFSPYHVRGHLGTLQLTPKGHLVTSENPLSPTESEDWTNRVTKKGRIPFVPYTGVCALCGTSKLELFYEKEWPKYVIPQLQNKVLCWDCYEGMRLLFPNGWKETNQHQGASPERWLSGQYLWRVDD